MRDNSGSDEIRVADIIAVSSRIADHVKRDRRLLWLPLMLCSVWGIFSAFATTAEFSARARLLPYRGGTSASGGLAGLAGLAGVRLPSSASADVLIPPSLYPELSQTLEFRISVAKTPISFSTGDSLMSAARYLSENAVRTPMSLAKRYTIEVPGRLLRALRSPQISGGDSAERVDYNIDSLPTQLTPSQRHLVNVVGNRVSVSVDSKTGVITVSATMPDPVAAADLVRVTTGRLTEIVLAFETRKIDEQLEYIEKQLQSSRQRYDAAQRAVAVFADQNRMLASATAQIERVRLEREAELAFEIFQQFAREREQARLKRSQDSPVFTIFEQVAVPTAKSQPLRTRVVVGWLGVGLLLGLARIGFRAVLSSDVNS